MNKKQKKWLARILTAAVLFVILEICMHTGVFEGKKWLGFLFALVPYLIVGYDVLLKAVRNISHGELFDESFLMMVATFGAFGIGEYPEAVAVMLLFQIGALFQNYATGKSRDSISGLMSIAPEYANLLRDGELEEVDPDEVEVGDTIVIKPGERVPLDGVVLEGESMLDTAALTGEPVPRAVRPGEDVISGCVNGQGTLKVRTTKAYEDSMVSRILEMVESATEKKTHVENFVTRFAKVYTPFVTISAVLLAVLPPLILGGGAEVWASWIRRACIFLVVSCPCALVISVPLGFFGGIVAASRIGVLVKGSNYLEAMSQVTTIVFDKTGTLTKGEFRVTQLLPARTGDRAEEELLELAACAEYYSNHPIAQSILEAYGKNIDTGRISHAEEISGSGIHTFIDGKEVLAGNAKLMRENGIAHAESSAPGTVVYLAREGRFEGTVVISDSVKEGVKEAVSDMKAAGIRKTVMLSGDREKAAQAVAQEIGIDEVRAELLPGDKVEELEKLLAEQTGKNRLAFVGDGINDAPALMRSDVGIAMGSMGSDAAIEAADIVLMDDDVRKIAATVRISRKTMGIIRGNIIFALAVKAVILILGALGCANMWMAIFGDVGVLIICILNAMRLLGRKTGQ
jgi:Cd2+/Zn2+-exporting ATPase